MFILIKIDLLSIRYSFDYFSSNVEFGIIWFLEYLRKFGIDVIF